MQARQGDVFLNEIDSLPELEDKIYSAMEGIEFKNAIILAHGEATGHKHAIYNTENIFLRKAKNDNRFFLVVENCGVLKHEEHAEIKIPIGIYEVRKQREYTFGNIRPVID